MKIFKLINSLIIAFFLFSYMAFEDIIPTFIDNAVAGIQSITVLVLALKNLKNAAEK